MHIATGNAGQKKIHSRGNIAPLRFKCFHFSLVKRLALLTRLCSMNWENMLEVQKLKSEFERSF